MAVFTVARPWWQTPGVLARWLTDLTCGELARLRPGRSIPVTSGADQWPASLPLGDAGLGLDSLERLQLAGALSEALDMALGGGDDRLLACGTFGEWCTVAGHSLDRFSATIGFRTSGSTGAPKAVAHALADLEQEAAFHAGSLAPRVGRIVTAVPSHHIYGFLFNILLPRALGDVPVLSVRSHGPAAMAGALRDADLVVGYPEFWSAALRAVAGVWPAGVCGVTSSGPMQAETTRRLEAAGLARVVHIHGSSETAGLGMRDTADGPYTLMPMWEHLPDGSLRRGAIAMPQPDRMEWLDDRRYCLLGRADGAVQVGGINVFPAQVQSALSQHPMVAAAIVRLMNPAEGSRLKAYVVPREPGADRSALVEALEMFARATLTTPEQPRAYAVGAALPVGSMGKAADWPIA